MGFFVGLITGSVVVLGLFDLHSFSITRNQAETLRLVRDIHQNLAETLPEKKRPINPVSLSVFIGKDPLKMRFDQLKSRLGYGEVPPPVIGGKIQKQDLQRFKQDQPLEIEPSQPGSQGLRETWNSGVRKIAEVVLGE